jgi:predicted RNA-binding protein with RPS1 domain
LSGLVVGEWREGKVTGIAGFGAFVDLGGVDGLVHVSQLGTGGYVERVEDVVQVGQVVRVRIAEVDMERGRVSLSMREPRAAPTAQRERTAPPATPRPPRPAGQAPTWSAEPAPDQRPDRRFRGNDRGYANRNEDKPKNRGDRSRRNRDSGDEDWRSVRGDPRNYYSYSDDAEEEPVPTTAEELVARFGRRDSNK